MNDFPLLINGELRAGDRTLPVINPATGAVFETCACASERQLDEAVAGAKAAFKDWSRQSFSVRAGYLNKLADAIDAEKEQLARLLTQEQGKPLPEALGEIEWSIGFIRYSTTLTTKIETIEDNGERRVQLHRRPLGVIGLIIPWNFPVLVVMFKLPSALMAGNTIVLKPSPTTPLTTLRIAALAAKIFPPGVVNVITDQNDLGGKMSAHPDIRKISFTGSTTTGKKVMASGADTLKRLTLELGGNDAAIVLGDVDPDEIAPSIYGGAFFNAGQVCLAIKRVYAHRTIYDALCDRLAKLADEAIVGDGLEQGTQIGPVQNLAQYEKVKGFIEDSRRHGKIIAGGTNGHQDGYFIRPTIVRDIPDHAAIVAEEQFGPVLPILPFDDVEDAVARANSLPFGLGGSIWTSDVKRGEQLAGELEAGTAWVNQHVHIGPHIPLVGFKSSGIGYELGEVGFNDFTQLQIVNTLLSR